MQSIRPIQHSIHAATARLRSAKQQQSMREASAEVQPSMRTKKGAAEGFRAERLTSRLEFLPFWKPVDWIIRGVDWIFRVVDWLTCRQVEEAYGNHVDRLLQPEECSAEGKNRAA